ERIATAELSWAVDFSPDARTLYTGGDKGILRVYDRAGQRQYLRRTQAVPARHYMYVLPSGDGDKTAYLWQNSAASWVSITDTASATTTAPTRLDLDLRQVARTTASWHSSGVRVAIHDRSSITVVDSRTGQVLKEIRSPYLASVAYIDHGDRLA